MRHPNRLHVNARIEALLEDAHAANSPRILPPRASVAAPPRRERAADFQPVPPSRQIGFTPAAERTETMPAPTIPPAPPTTGDGFPGDFEDDDPDGDHACGEMKAVVAPALVAKYAKPMPGGYATPARRLIYPGDPGAPTFAELIGRLHNALDEPRRIASELRDLADNLDADAINEEPGFLNKKRPHRDLDAADFSKECESIFDKIRWTQSGLSFFQDEARVIDGAVARIVASDASAASYEDDGDVDDDGGSLAGIGGIV